jgi:hypothetical protein
MMPNEEYSPGLGSGDSEDHGRYCHLTRRRFKRAAAGNASCPSPGTSATDSTGGREPANWWWRGLACEPRRCTIPSHSRTCLRTSPAAGVAADPPSTLWVAQQSARPVWFTWSAAAGLSRIEFPFTRDGYLVHRGRSTRPKSCPEVRLPTITIDGRRTITNHTSTPNRARSISTKAFQAEFAATCHDPGSDDAIVRACLSLFER